MQIEDVDVELYQAVLDSFPELDPRANIPQSEMNRIARAAVAEDKVTDGEWIYQRIQDAKRDFRRKRNIAKVRGYAPFTCLSLRVVTKLRETFGEDMLELMRQYLKDPEDIYTKWSYRFAATVDAIGRAECLSHRENIYSFVTQHQLWEELREKITEDFRNWMGFPNDDRGPPSPDRPEEQAPSASEETPAPAQEVSAATAPT